MKVKAIVQIMVSTIVLSIYVARKCYSRIIAISTYVLIAKDRSPEKETEEAAKYRKRGYIVASVFIFTPN